IAGPAFDALETDAFTHPAYIEVRRLMGEAGGAAAGLSGADWIHAIADRTDDLTLRAMISELASEPLPVKTTNDIPRFITGVLANAQAAWVGRQIAELKSRLHRVSSVDDPDTYMALFGDLVALEQYRKSLLEQAMGNDGHSAAG
ncbi:DNA primase, partial [Nocardia sp. NPDC003345]